MQFDDDQLERMRNDPENYKWVIFYFNSKDPRMIVPKRNRIMGWTLNFANPYSYLILLGIAVFAIFMSNLYSK
jgi:uncharacterized membrane protein